MSAGDVSAPEDQLNQSGYRGDEKRFKGNHPRFPFSVALRALGFGFRQGKPAASSERRPNFSSAQSLSSVISLVDSFGTILLCAISRKFFLSSLRFKRRFQLPADAQSAKQIPAFDR